MAAIAAAAAARVQLSGRLLLLSDTLPAAGLVIPAAAPTGPEPVSSVLHAVVPVVVFLRLKRGSFR